MKTKKWSRPDDGPNTYGYQVTEYTDGTLELTDDGLSEPLKRVGTIPDGNNNSDVLQSKSGLVVCLYQAGMQVFENWESWVDSLPDDEKEGAAALFEN